MVARLLAVAGLLVAVGAAKAESIRYELYEVHEDGNRALLERGVRTYTLDDVVVARSWLTQKTFWSKEIPVAKGFAAGASIYREPELKGFGLWLRDRGSILGRITGGGFSWDWFNQESGLVYRKLQGGGRVRVTLVPSTQFEEIAAVEVLEDITLRVNTHVFLNDRDTYNLVVTKGSVLRFSP